MPNAHTWDTEYEPFVEFGLEGTTAGLKTVRVTLGFLASLTIALAAVATVEDGDFRFLSFSFLFFLLSLLSFLWGEALNWISLSLLLLSFLLPPPPPLLLQHPASGVTWDKIVKAKFVDVRLYLSESPETRFYKILEDLTIICNIMQDSKYFTRSTL